MSVDLSRKEGGSLGMATCRRLTAALSILLLLQLAVAFPSGAPEKACKDLRPGHGHEPSTETAPYKLTQDQLQAIAGDQIKVKLSATDDTTTFKGLMVQAVDEKGEPRGKFLPGSGLKLLGACSAVTHSDREPKKTATLVWEAPADMKSKQPIAFKATVVQKFDKIFADIKSTMATK